MTFISGKIHKKPLFSQFPLVAQNQTYTLRPYSLIFFDNNKVRVHHKNRTGKETTNGIEVCVKNK
jgi:hypothetical protein